MQKLSLVLGLLLCLCTYVNAQRTITGTVTDDSGEALIGATILVENTSTGTITDFDGTYSLKVPDGATNLVFSYTGYATQTASIGASNVLDVTMNQDAIGLEDIIVIGYAPTRRKDVTGSVSSVSSDDIATEANVGIQTALRGRAAGVTVVQSSGTPGSGVDVRVRGSTSISASNKPLYVVDGVPLIDQNFSGDDSFGQNDIGGQTTNSIADLNPADIESIEVLKDASSAAIYGSRGANGVVLITTKRGSAGKTSINLNTSYGWQQAVKTIDIVDGPTYRDYLTELFGSPDVGAGGLGGNSNWQEEVLQTSNVADVNLSLSGGDTKTRFYGSLGYNNNEGIVKGSEYSRYSGRLNIDHFASDKLTFGMNMSYTNAEQKQIQNDNNIYGVISTSILLPPTVPVRNEDGTYGSAFGLENPVAGTEVYDNFVRTNRLIGNVFAKYELAEGLSFKALAGVDSYDFLNEVYEPATLQSSPDGARSNGTIRDVRWLTEYTLTYQKTMGNNRLTAVVGTGQQQDNIRNSYLVVTGFPTTEFSAIGAGANATTFRGNYTGDALQSYFANVNYSIDGRYILTGVFRTDGSSRFINNRFGYFPGVSAAWRISDEDFMSDVNIDDLKLRVGYGITGNNNIGNFTSRQLYQGGNNYTTAPGIAPSQLGNPDLKWETTKQFNAGIDFAFANQRVSGSFDFYLKDTDDLLLDRPIPTTSGFTSVPQNIGEIRNTGVELSLTTINVSSGDLTWETTLTAAYNDNEVLALFDDQPIDRGFATRIAVGQPIGAFFGYQTDGIFQNDAEVEAHATQGNAAPGDIRFVDVNGDGNINADDRTFIGNALPDLTGGLTSNLSYKGLTFDFFFQYSLGNEVLNNNLAFAEGLNGVFAPTQRAFDGAWRAEGDGDEFPRIVRGDPAGNRRDSDRFVEDGSFLRLKTLTLGYSLPKSILGDAFSRAKIYVSGTNLLTFTNYSWFDPEVNTFSGDNVALGTDFLTYPQAKSINIGINLGF